MNIISHLNYQSNGNPTGRPYWQARKKLDCGTAERLLLKAGDAYIMHQRLATGLSANASDTPATFAEFRIETVNMELLFDQFNYSELPFEGFEGLVDLNLTANLARKCVDPQDLSG